MSFTRIQGTGAKSTTSTTSQSATLAGVTAGHALFVVADCYVNIGGAPTTTIADSQGNTWLTAVSNPAVYIGTAARTTVFYSIVTTGGTVTVTVTSSVAGSVALSLEEWSFAGPLGVESTATGTSSGFSSAAVTGSLSLTGTDLVVAGFDILTSGLTYTPSSGFTAGYTTNAGNPSQPFATEYNAAQSATPVAPGFTLSSTTLWSGVSAAFFDSAHGSLSVAEGHNTLAALGIFASPSTIARTEARDSLAGAGNAVDVATFTATGRADTLAAPAVFRSTATISRTEGPDLGAIAGNSPRTAALGATEAHDSLAAAGWCIVATITRTSGADSLAALGAGTAVATFSRTESHDSLAARSTDTTTATFTRTGGTDSLAAPGDALVHGSVGATGRSDTLAAAGSGGIVGSIARAEAHDSLVAAGRMSAVATLAVTAPNDDRLMTGSILEYHVYANGGSGAIDYGTPVATTGLLTWTSGVLACNADWRFGVRCFDPGSGLEEKNLDCSVEIILDAGCTDITNRPAAPFGLRAFAVAGGSVKVEWYFPRTTGPRKPTGFHVYKGVGAVSYITPAATVLYSAGFANTFQATLAGLADGVVYSIGVRAYNSSAEEKNTAFVTVTADSTGPSPVVGLTGTAIV